MNRIILILCFALTSLCAEAQTLRQMNDNGSFNSMDADGNTTNKNFNKHNNENTQNNRNILCYYLMILTVHHETDNHSKNGADNESSSIVNRVVVAIFRRLALDGITTILIIRFESMAS